MYLGIVPGGQCVAAASRSGGQHVEGDLDVVVVRRSCRRAGPALAVAVAAHAFRPDVLSRSPRSWPGRRDSTSRDRSTRSSSRVSKRIMPASGVASADLGREVEVLLVVGQVADGKALLHRLVELHERQPGLLGQRRLLHALDL